MSITKLGSKISTIKKTLKEKWSDFGDLSKKEKNFLERKHKKVHELIDDYNKKFDEDYSMEEI
jgi:hypothetical protein